VETLAALVLVTLAFGAGAMIYLNVLSTSNIAVKEKAHLILEQVSQTTISTERYVSEELIEQQFRIEKTIQPYRNNAKVYLLQLNAFDEREKLIATHRELITIKPKKDEEKKK
jgi:hypothetical protein